MLRSGVWWRRLPAHAQRTTGRGWQTLEWWGERWCERQAFGAPQAGQLRCMGLPRRTLGRSAFANSDGGAILRLAWALIFDRLRSSRELFGATILDNAPSF